MKSDQILVVVKVLTIAAGFLCAAGVYAGAAWLGLLSLVFSAAFVAGVIKATVEIIARLPRG